MTRLAARIQLKGSIVTVLTVSMVLTIVILMGLTTALEIRRERAIFQTHMEEKALLLVSAANHLVGDSSESLDRDALDRLAAVIDEQPDISHFELLSPDGILLASLRGRPPEAGVSADDALGRAIQSREPVSRLTGDALEIASPLEVDGQVVGVVQFGFDQAPLRLAIGQFAIQRLVQTLIFLVIGVSLAYLAARHFARPVRNLAQAARDVGEGNFHASVASEEGRGDEIGELARAFSTMTHALRDYRERLEETQERNIQSAKMAAVGQLAGGVAHEINNPLASILGFAQLGKQKLSTLHGKPIEQKDIIFLERYLGYIEGEAKRTGQIVSRLLTFTLSPEREMSPVDVNQLLEQAVRMNTNQIAMSGIKCELQLAEALPLVDGHTASLAQVFNSIIGNAITAMPQGGTLRIASSYLAPDSAAPTGMVEIQFEDTGFGIPEENVSKVFEPFFTTAEPGEGTGLGMYVCYQVVRQHEGETEISSREGEGTTVTIRLPASSLEEEKADGV